MGVFGERLQREREMRGITLDEISEATKIGTRALQALESEDFDKLPGGIFNKGFVRAYARYLGINEEQAVADYLSAAKECEEPQADLDPAVVVEDVAPTEESGSGVGASWRVFLSILLVAVIAAAGWYFYSRRQRQQETVVPATNERAPEASTVAGPPAALPAQTTPAHAPTPRSQSGAPVQSPVAASKAPGSTPELTSKPAAAITEKGSGFELHIRAIQDSWMQVTADGRTVIDRTMKASEETSVRAAKEIVLITGNAGGIELSHNGNPITSLGPENVRRKVTFTSEGIQQ